MKWSTFLATFWFRKFIRVDRKILGCVWSEMVVAMLATRWMDEWMDELSWVFCMLQSFSYIKATASVKKSLHQYHGLYYLHLPIFFLIHTLLSCWKKIGVITVSLRKLYHRPLFNDIYYKTKCRDWLSIWLRNATYCL